MTATISLTRDNTFFEASCLVELLANGSAVEALPDWVFGAAGQRAETLFALGAGTLAEECADRGALRLVRHTFRPADRPGVLAVRLCLTNQGKEPVQVATLSPVIVGPAGLRLGEAPAGDWVYLRQPRHKNDMPAATILGGKSAGVWDAVRGTPETGGAPAGGDAGQRPTRFISSEVMAVRAGGAGALLGLFPLDQQLVQSVLDLSPDRRSLAGLRVDCLCDGQELPPGETLTSQWVLVDLDPDPFAALERYADLLLSAHPGARERREAAGRPPTVWCSWYYYGDGLSQQEAEANLDALLTRWATPEQSKIENRKSKIPVDVFQIDECWDQEWGDWIPNDRWSGVATFARRVGAAGYRPGIWTCPLLADIRSTTRYHNPHWLLRNRDGKPVRFRMGDTLSYVLDPTHPEVLRFLEDLYRRLTHEWGYTYHKLDFTRAIGEPDALFHDRSKNRAQAYRMALDAVRRGAGDQAYINVCGGFYGPLIGLSDAQRTGSDVTSTWPHPPAGQEAEGYGPFTIKQNTLRFWMNRLWDNDPDALMVRRRPVAYRDEILSIGLLTDDEALTGALNQYLGGGLVCFTENLAEVDEDRLLLLRHCAPSLGQAAIPRDALAGARFPGLFDTTVVPAAAGLPEWHTLSVVNWHAEPRTFTVALDEATLGAFAGRHEAFLVSAFAGGWCRRAGRGETLQVGPVAPHGCEVLKVQPAGDGPCILRTNGHFSMGGTEVTRWEPHAGGVSLEIHWPWPTPLEVVVAPAAGRQFAGGEGDGTYRLHVVGPLAEPQDVSLPFRE